MVWHVKITLPYLDNKILLDKPFNNLRDISDELLIPFGRINELCKINNGRVGNRYLESPFYPIIDIVKKGPQVREKDKKPKNKPFITKKRKKRNQITFGQKPKYNYIKNLYKPKVIKPNVSKEDTKENIDASIFLSFLQPCVKESEEELLVFDTGLNYK